MKTVTLENCTSTTCYVDNIYEVAPLDVVIAVQHKMFIR